MTVEAPQLVLIRQLADEATHQLGRGDDFGNGLSVSLMQDAVELLVRVVVRTRGIEVSGRATWDQMADAIGKDAVDESGKVPHRARLEDLNKARVAFKHTGTAPSKADARRLVRFGLEFLEVAVPRFMDIEYGKISLSIAVHNDEVRQLLQRAEKLLQEGAWRDAVIEATDAVNRAEVPTRTLLPPASSLSHLQGGSPGLVAYLDRVRLTSVASLIDIDPVELLIFRHIAPSVHRSMTGDRSVTLTHSAYTEENARSAVEFATKFALAVERRFGSGLDSPVLAKRMMSAPARNG